MSSKNPFFEKLLQDAKIDDLSHVQSNAVPQNLNLGKVFVVCGPTAVGKGTVLKEVFAKLENAWYSVSATTRPARPEEVNGTDYFFLSNEEFSELIAAGKMLEWATVHQVHRYGTPAQPVFAAIAAGKTVILEVDLAGARQIRRSLPHAPQIFILPPSWEELAARLKLRGTESAVEQARRLETARTELAAKDEFDYLVVNDTVANATEKILQIITGNR